LRTNLAGARPQQQNHYKAIVGHKMNKGARKGNRVHHPNRTGGEEVVNNLGGGWTNTPTRTTVGHEGAFRKWVLT